MPDMCLSDQNQNRTKSRLDENNMAAAVPMLDDIIKEYLVFRGFSSTLKSFESDLKADKDKSFRVGCFLLVLFDLSHSFCESCELACAVTVLFWNINIELKIG